MKKLFVLAVLALALPSVALAKPPATHTNKSHAAPKVMYILKGPLSNYIPATSTTEGSISITVKHTNYHGRALKDQTLTFTVASNTRVVNGTAPLGPNARGMVKFKAPLRFPSGTNLVTTLPTMAKAFHVIVQNSGN